jgi:hypothetical protein
VKLWKLLLEFVTSTVKYKITKVLSSRVVKPKVTLGALLEN